MQKIRTINEAVEILKSGGILAHPADTCFGLAGDLMNEETLKKIQQIKGREASKPMSIMLPQLGAMSYELGDRRSEKNPQLHAPRSTLQDYVELSDFAQQVCDRFLPGPITILLPKGPKIPAWYFPETGWIGIRMVDDEQVNELLEAFDGPIITTSANLSSQPTCYEPEEVLEIFKEREVKPDGILMEKILKKKSPSTVIKVEGNKIEVLREGPVKVEGLF